MSFQSIFMRNVVRFCGLLLTSMTAGAAASADSYTLASPDETIQVSINVSDAIQYSVTVDGKEMLRPSRLAMTLKDGTQLGAQPVFLGRRSRSVDQVLSPVVPVKSSKIHDRFNETVFSFEGDYRVVFRAYNNGVAYRFETAFAQPIQVIEELVEYDFPAEAHVYFPKEDSFQSHNERTYLYTQMRDLKEGELASLPALVSTAGIKVLISETDLRDYAGLWIESAGGGALDWCSAQICALDRNERRVGPQRNCDRASRLYRGHQWRAYFPVAVPGYCSHRR
ncbi:glycoside hydrolase family 97 N-terminal domain-containing protein [Kordiimonas sp.]|uniref:glycoside hydrolase family 97 N-terminal domain-containing protein n=1 Tax=Kordiimonas sp. TaxID=1970157 RepID=UPI003A8E19AA